MQIDIEGMLATAAADVMAPENLMPKLNKALTDALESAIGSAMGHRSEFRAMLDKQVAEAMPNGLEGVARIGELVAKRVTDIISQQQNTALDQLITQQLEGILKPVPTTLKLSELYRELVHGWDRRDYDRPEGSQPTLILERNSYGMTELYLDKNEDVDRRETAIQVTLSSDFKILQLRIRDEEVSGNTRLVSRRWNDELYLTQLFAGKTVFEVDVPEGGHHDLYYSGE